MSADHARVAEEQVQKKKCVRDVTLKKESWVSVLNRMCQGTYGSGEGKFDYEEFGMNKGTERGRCFFCNGEKLRVEQGQRVLGGMGTKGPISNLLTLGFLQHTRTVGPLHQQNSTCSWMNPWMWNLWIWRPDYTCYFKKVASQLDQELRREFPKDERPGKWLGKPRTWAERLWVENLLAVLPYSNYLTFHVRLFSP